MVLEEFDLIAAPNEDVLIWHLQDGFQLSIRAQLDERDHNLDDWNKAIEKAIDARAKTSRQVFLGMRKIDTCCLRGQQPSKAKKPAKNVEKSKLSQNPLAHTSSQLGQG